MQRIYSHPNAGIVQLVKNALDQHGIEAVVRGEYLGVAVGDVPQQEAWTGLWVADTARLSEAARVVREFVEANDAAEGGEPWTCPRCGEEVEAAFDACWRCGAERPEAPAA
jgi:hypothetical protein